MFLTILSAFATEFLRVSMAFCRSLLLSRLIQFHCLPLSIRYAYTYNKVNYATQNSTRPATVSQEGTRGQVHCPHLSLI